MHRIAFAVTQTFPSVCPFLICFSMNYPFFLLQLFNRLVQSTSQYCWIISMFSSNLPVFAFFLWGPSAFLFSKFQHCLPLHTEMKSYSVWLLARLLISSTIFDVASTTAAYYYFISQILFSFKL